MLSQWQTDLATQVRVAISQEEIFNAILTTVLAFGFEYCTYASSALVPCAQPRVVSISNFPTDWQQWYLESGALQVDPVLNQCRRSDELVMWGAATYTDAPMIWAQARKLGITFACSQSAPASLGLGARGILTLASRMPGITADEPQWLAPAIAYITKVTHEAMLRVANFTVDQQVPSALTERECEVLRWTGDGKTAAEIALILCVSENTVKFHVKNAIIKLGTANKTAAVVKAALLGLLH